MPQAILDNFKHEFDIPVRFLPYTDQDEAVAWMRAGEPLDVVVLSDTYIPAAIQEGLLAELDFANIPNFHNLGMSFRDLIFDPENRHSVMLQWGTTGLVVRTSRVTEPVTNWNDLWNPAYAGKIGVWPYKDELIGITIKSLGYSLSTEDPDQLEATRTKLIELRKNVYLLDPNLPTGASYLQDDQTVMIYGWNYDALQAQERLEDIAYVLPQEGALLWTDNLVVPAGSKRKQDAEIFINFLLRPEISAMLTNELSIPTPNEAARIFIKPEILNNPLVFPPPESLQQAEFYPVVGQATRERYDAMWEDFLNTEGPAPGR